VPRTRVKICGLMRAEDARTAAQAGADALGVILAPGHRRSLTSKEAADVFAGAPEGIERVGVFVDAPLDEAVDAVQRAGLTEVQLHGSESPAYCAAVRTGGVAPVRVVKTFHVGAGFKARAIERYRGRVDAILLDTQVEGAVGGTGRSFDWALVEQVPAIAPVYLAGGLTPENVRDAVTQVRPEGVDVSSGVEQAAGSKSDEKMQRFVAEVRAADREIEEQQ